MLTNTLQQMSTDDLQHLQQLLLNYENDVLSPDVMESLALLTGAPCLGQVTPLATEELEQKAAAEVSLHEFLRQAWTVVEPSEPFKDGEHIRAYCLHLEAVTRGDIDNLLINVPPGCCKSTTCSVIWPAWNWVQDARTRLLTFSYAGTLAMRDSWRSRLVMQSQWFQRFWGDRFRFAADQNSKAQYANDKTGWRISAGVGGRGTGEHPDIIIVDDPLNAREAASEADRKGVNEWWDGTIASRGKTRNVRRVVIMQRLNEDDLSGHILERMADDWVHLCLPMRAEPGRMKRTSIGWEDTRNSGQLLWPEAMPEAVVRTTEREMGPVKAAGQLQQRPVPEGGALFKRDWFQVVPAVPLPAGLPRVRFWDCAVSEADSADETAGIRLAKHGDYIICENIEHGRWGPGPRDSMIKQVAMLDGREVPIYIEEEGGAGGRTLVHNYVVMLAGWSVKGVRHEQNKYMRAQGLAGYAEAGLVKLMDGPNTQALLDQLSIFPNGKHDDLVDAFSAAFNILVRIAGFEANMGRELICSGDKDEQYRPGTRLTDDELEDPDTPDFLRDILGHLREDRKQYGLDDDM
jgi:predicted phage terminase large subunit-like protein